MRGWTTMCIDLLSKLDTYNNERCTQVVGNGGSAIQNVSQNMICRDTPSYMSFFQGKLGCRRDLYDMYMMLRRQDACSGAHRPHGAVVFSGQRHRNRDGTIKTHPRHPDGQLLRKIETGEMCC